MLISNVLQIAGLALLILAAVSGISLFLRANADTGGHTDSSTRTLWGLFIIGLIVGLLVTWLTSR